MFIGALELANNLVVAPMAGVTDRPFRQLCRAMGAGLAVSEMVTSDRRLWSTGKSRRRMDHAGEVEPRSVQIAGADPQMMADAARENADRGAQLIDINMGCPAKKVCNRMAGSALLADEVLVGRILEAVVGAVAVPVTLKIRTGPAPDDRNGERIARIAEQSGVMALAVHGRTRACAFRGEAEYETIRAIKRAVSIPVIANGDIDSPEKARRVLAETGADGIMVGRAAQGRPWIFREIAHYLATGTKLPEPGPAEAGEILLGHLENLYGFYGVELGVRVARKHIGWYAGSQPGHEGFRQSVMRVDSASEQYRRVRGYFDRLANGEELAA
ncbi:MAG: tRNA dihydrouridine synthase DusB [Xanthomonadaceae bacterium]|nr:tRNA dihydrouridine synthase DusB [Xanthomonadaceae bacterium]